jgi:hypothetical protein
VRVVGGQSPSGDNAMDVGMGLKRLSPGVQDGEETDVGTETLRIGRHFEQSGGAGFEQEFEQESLVLPDQGNEGMRHAEDQVEVADGQQFLLALGEPLVASVGLTLGAVPVAARVVRDSLMAAACALISMSTECSGAATRDGIEHLGLGPGQGRTIAFAESVACLADHIGHLKGWPRHPCRSSGTVRNVSWSKGLMAACR